MQKAALTLGRRVTFASIADRSTPTSAVTFRAFEDSLVVFLLPGFASLFAVAVMCLSPESPPCVQDAGVRSARRPWRRTVHAREATTRFARVALRARSEEHTSELQS